MSKEFRSSPSCITVYKEKGLEIVGISVDRGGPECGEEIRGEERMCLTHRHGHMKVVDAYEVYTGIPTTFIIDRQGRVVDKVIGYHPKSYFEEQIKKLL